MGGTGRLGAEEISQFNQGRANVYQSKAADGAAHVIAGQHRLQRRRPFDEVVPLPESRPRDQHQEETGFEQEGDEDQAPEQKSAPRLNFGQPIDVAQYVAVAAGLGFKLNEHGEGARALADLFEGLG